MTDILQKFVLYGCVGILIEFFFTSVSSLIKRRWALTGQSYGWMAPIYGLTALFLEAISESLTWPFWAKALIYVPIIYGTEAVSGLTIRFITKYLQKFLGGTGGGSIPWEYNKSKWTLHGLIQPKYIGFWYILACAFEPISVFL